MSNIVPDEGTTCLLQRLICSTGDCKVGAAQLTAGGTVVHSDVGGAVLAGSVVDTGLQSVHCSYLWLAQWMQHKQVDADVVCLTLALTERCASTTRTQLDC